MTSARRACVAVAVATALGLTAVLVTRPVPLRRPGPAAAPAAVSPGGPIVRAPLPPALAAATAALAARNITSEGSLNWAGYAVNRPGSRFSLIRATFFVPYLACSRSRGLTLSSDWVGLDGFVSKPDSVEQGGIGADCSAAGKASYYAWWETFPRPETRLGLRVRPGDSVTAAVSYDAARHDFTITVTNNTRGGHVAVTRKCPRVKIGKRYVICPRNSAEVISEAPAVASGHSVVIAHLSDYDAVSFEAIAIADSSRHRGTVVSSHWSTTKIIQLRPSGALVALPTATQTASFDNYWLREN